jgi:two-component system, LytTR family, response regulator
MSMPLRVLVCDDEMIARQRAVRLVQEAPNVEVVAECASGDEVLAKLAAEDVDVVLLDINMPGMTGIETTMKMPEDRPYVIFLTAHPEHAVQAFDVGATDYLLKPVDQARLEKALDRARKELDAPAGLRAGTDPPLARLAISTKAGVVLLAPEELTHAVFDGSLVTVHTKDRSVLTDQSLQDLEAKLAKSGAFERVHRRALLNLLMVERLEPVLSGGYVARLVSGKTVDISRQAARKLRRRLGIS